MSFCKDCGKPLGKKEVYIDEEEKIGPMAALAIGSAIGSLGKKKCEKCGGNMKKGDNLDLFVSGLKNDIDSILKTLDKAKKAIINSGSGKLQNDAANALSTSYQLKRNIKGMEDAISKLKR